MKKNYIVLKISDLNQVVKEPKLSSTQHFND